MGEDVELWRSFISRDIPNWQTMNWVPKNPLKWYEVYCKYKKWQRDIIARDEENLRIQMGLLKERKDTHVSKVVDLRTLPKIPKDPRMLANNGGVPIGRSRGIVKPGTTILTWNSGSRTKTSTSQGVLAKARREAREISLRGKLSRPMQPAHHWNSQPMKAPAAMVNEYRRAAEVPVKILSRRNKVAGTLIGGIGNPSLDDREKRLRALTMSSGAGSKQILFGDLKETLVGSSDDDVDEDVDELDELDDLFDERQPDSQPPAASKSKLSASNLNSTPSRPQSSVSLSSEAFPPLASKRRIAAPVSSTHTSSSSSLPVSSRVSKPSDIVSSIISRPRPAPHVSSSPLTQCSPDVRSRNSSPENGMAKPRPVMQRKRVEVDIFARPKKKLRTT